MGLSCVYCSLNAAGAQTYLVGQFPGFRAHFLAPTLRVWSLPPALGVANEFSLILAFYPFTFVI